MGRAMTLAIEIIGWASAAIILAAYILLSLDRIGPRTITYQAMNVIGAAGFIINSGYNGALPSAGLNVIWMAMGLFALGRILRARPA